MFVDGQQKIKNLLEPKIVILGKTACQQTVAMATRKYGKFV